MIAMSDTELRVTYRNGDPIKIKFGSGYFGDPCSLAQMKSDEDSTAIVMFDNAGSTDFVKELKRLPFVETVLEPNDA